MDLKAYILLCFIVPYLTIGNFTYKEQNKRNITEGLKIYTKLKEELLNHNISHVCSSNEVIQLCESCTKTCVNADMCTGVCKECFCGKSQIGNINAQCTECERAKRDDPKITEGPIPYQLSCGDHQEYSSCRRCDRTCTEPNPACNGSCIAGCFCDDGYLKGPDGRCILLQDCPKAEIMLAINDPSIDECQADEVFTWCGWCEGSCSEPVPQCPEATCTRGCLCRPPLLRHYTGLCVEEKDCLPKLCKDPNEEYTCRYGCEPRCIQLTCSRPQRCRLGCNCKRGLFRNAQGKCVPAEDCFKKNSTIF